MFIVFYYLLLSFFNASCGLYMQLILALLLIALRVTVIIYLINVHCGHFLMIVHVWSSYAL